MNIKKQTPGRIVILICFFMAILFAYPAKLVFPQVQGTAKKYIRIGSLHNHYTAYGSERAWNNSYYEGLVWPAHYPYQDNAVIKRFWLGCKDFTDVNAKEWEAYGIYFALSYEGEALFPVELKQTAKFERPTVYVDGRDITLPYRGQVDEVNPDQIPDRIVHNVVNTSMGLTLTRRIYAFSQQYHDNYHIKEFTYTNTGNVDYDDQIELDAPIKELYISWGTRYSVCREGSFNIGGSQSWGQHMWVTKRGEDYPAHANDEITATDPIVDWIRCGFGWAGQNAENSYDNIGGPQVTGTGRLTAPQHAGVAILHVDKSPADHTDDPNQPLVLGWHGGDTYPKLGDMSGEFADNMVRLYNMLSGSPYKGLGGTDRFDESYMDSHQDPWTVHNDGGGTNIWVSYGPFDLAHGESITIVEVEGVSGLSRKMCRQIGKRWKKAYDDPSDSGPFDLPDGSTTTDEDEYKNQWVYTGKDSILLTFSRALRNYRLQYEIPKPPLPPPLFDVNSGGDRISLSWSPSPSENEPGFAGYKIFRAIGRPDTTYEEITSCDPGVTSYDDMAAKRGFSYYYYIVAYNDGTNNTEGKTNPTGPLYSSRFYTRTTEPAYLRRIAGQRLDDIRVVPNPYNIRARRMQYTGEPDKIMFLNIPGYCTIRIYTERGDLIKKIEHNDGSGDETWNSNTSSRQVVVSGIYIAHFTVNKDYYDQETDQLLYKKGDTAYRKFVIIR